MIAAQLFLLSLLIKYRPGSFASSSFSVSSSDQPQAPGTPTKASSGNGTSSSQHNRTTPFSFDVQPPTPVSGQEERDAPLKRPSSFKIGIKGYAPLLNNFDLPAAPVLSYVDEDEEDESETQHSRQAKLRKASNKTVRFLQAGFRMGEEKRLDGSSGSRPFGFWTWQTLNSYLIFLLLLVVFLAILQLTIGYFSIYTALLGYFALGLESTLPIPQALINQKRKSLSGFRWTVLAGWLIGDSFKTFYFIVRGSPLQFTVCALFQLSIDCVICAQMYFFQEQTAKDEEEQRLTEAEAMEIGRGGSSRREAEDASLEDVSAGPPNHSSSGSASHFRIEADEDDDDEGDDIGTKR